MISLRSRYVFLPTLLIFITVLLLFFRASLVPHAAPPPEEVKPEGEKHPVYKPPKPEKPPPIPEYFPLAASAKSPADLPPVPSWNKPPDPHVPEKTRLYIGFTRYWPLLQQVVISYITAGWPPEDIYVIENTGTFDANRRGLLSSSNPFYLDYHRLTKIFGVNVVTTPSLQTFAQLQNFYLSEAINSNHSYYFWGHMDVVAQTHEDIKPYRSLYQIAVDTIRESMAPDYGTDPETGERKQWAIRFFSYDWLAMVNVESYVKVGGWDTMIGYYGTDCDMHSRLAMNDLTMPVADAGQVFDVGRSLDDLEVLYRRKKKTGASKEKSEKTGKTEKKEPRDTGEIEDPKYKQDLNAPKVSAVVAAIASKTPTAEAAKPKANKDDPPGAFSGNGDEISFTHRSTSSTKSSSASGANADYLSTTEEDEIGSPNWTALQETLEAMAEEKRQDPYRNSWQLKQRGGEGDPYYYDADGWEQALQMTIDMGRKIMDEKWGHRGCDLQESGLKEGDQWRVEHDW